MQISDEQTLATLRQLKTSGALERRDSKTGTLKELDPAIASDLLNGEKVMGGSSLSLSHPMDIPRQYTPLPSLGDKKEGLARAAGLEAMATDELMARLAGDCEAFNQNLVVNFNTAKELMHRNFVELFKSVSKEKLPDSFLRSLPKWGKGATKLHQMFNKTMNKKPTDTGMDQKDVPFELVIQPEVLQEIGMDIHTLIENELNKCVGTNGVIINDMQKILMQVTLVMERLRLLEERLSKEEVERRLLEDRLHDERQLNKELSQTIDTLNNESRDKETQMDILRDQVQREREQTKLKRADFFKEIIRYKEQILQLTGEAADAHDYRPRVEKPKTAPDTSDLLTSPKPQAPRSESLADLGNMDSLTGLAGGGGVADLEGSDHADIQYLLDQKERECKADFVEHLRALKLLHSDQLKALKMQMKVACQERDDTNANLQKRIKKLEFELVEEKRKLRRFLNTIEKDQTD